MQLINPSDYRPAQPSPVAIPCDYRESKHYLNLDLTELAKPIEEIPELVTILPKHFRNFSYPSTAEVFRDICYQATIGSQLKGVQLTEVCVSKYINGNCSMDDTKVLFNIDYSDVSHGTRSPGSTSVDFDGSTIYFLGKPVKLLFGGNEILKAFLEVKGLKLES